MFYVTASLRGLTKNILLLDFSPVNQEDAALQYLLSYAEREQ